MFPFTGFSRRLWMAIGMSLALALGSPLSALANVALIQISSDPYTNTDSQHRTEVEPDTFAVGSTIVAAMQVGRFFSGGSSNIGFATSTNGGQSWTQGFLPGTTVNSTPPGPYLRASDPVVAYDAKHGVWIISYLGIVDPAGPVDVLVSRSTDGLTWSSPFVVNNSGDFNDKNWTACDNTATSPFYGNCYTEWDDNGAGNRMEMSTSTDAGLTWSVAATNGNGIIGGQPVVRPDGTVIVPTANANETAIGAFNSTNGGASWSAVTTIATVRHHTVAGSLREGPLPSAEIDGAGTGYVVWADSRFRTGGKLNDIVITHSLNATGTSWSAITRVPIDATNSKIDHFIPGLAVNKAT